MCSNKIIKKNSCTYLSSFTGLCAIETWEIYDLMSQLPYVCLVLLSPMIVIFSRDPRQGFFIYPTPYDLQGTNLAWPCFAWAWPRRRGTRSSPSWKASPVGRPRRSGRTWWGRRSREWTPHSATAKSPGVVWSVKPRKNVDRWLQIAFKIRVEGSNGWKSSWAQCKQFHSFCKLDQIVVVMTKWIRRTQCKHALSPFWYGNDN